MKQPINFICTPECEISVSPDLSVSAVLSKMGERQALAIAQMLLGHSGKVSLYSSSKESALLASMAIVRTAQIAGLIISPALDKQSSRSSFEVDGRVEVIGLDEVGLPVYTEEDQKRMTNIYDMLCRDPRNMPTYAVTEKDSIFALLGALGVNNKGIEIQPGTVTSIARISEQSNEAITVLPDLPGEQPFQDVLVA